MKGFSGRFILLLSGSILLAFSDSRSDDSAAPGWGNRFVSLPNGVVADTKTGLEWFAGPDEDTSYYRAAEWVANLSVAGGGWRMPTAKELRTLYRTPGKPSTITPLLKTKGIHVWPYQVNEDLSLYLFRYMDPYGTRGMAVRSASKSGRLNLRKSARMPSP
jgi:hypothetical protein